MIGFAGGNAGSTNTARMFIALKPLGERKLSADQVIARLRKKTSHVAGATLYLQAVQDSADRRPLEQRALSVHAAGIRLAGTEPWAPRLLQKMRGLPILTDVNSDQQNCGLEATAGDRPRHGVAPRVSRSR